MTRADVLDKAKEQINGSRVTDYGKPENNFGVIAGLWSAYLGIDISAVDVAMMMSLLKIARVKSGHGGTEDCFVDLAGYAACGGEIVGNERDEKSNRDRAFKLWLKGFSADKIEEEVGIDISKAKEYVEYFERHCSSLTTSEREKHATEIASTNKTDEHKDGHDEDQGLFAMIRDYYDQNPNKCYKEIADELALDICTVEGVLKNYPKKGIVPAPPKDKDNHGWAIAANERSRGIVPAPPRYDGLADGMMPYNKSKDGDDPVKEPKITCANNDFPKVWPSMWSNRAIVDGLIHEGRNYDTWLDIVKKRGEADWRDFIMLYDDEYKTSMIAESPSNLRSTEDVIKWGRDYDEKQKEKKSN